MLRSVVVVLASVALGRSIEAQGPVGRVFRVTVPDSARPRIFTGMEISTGSYTTSEGVRRYKYVTVDSVLPASPAAAAGIRQGDEILSINGFDVAAQRDSARFPGAGIPTPVRLRRGANILEVTLVPTQSTRP